MTFRSPKRSTATASPSHATTEDGTEEEQELPTRARQHAQKNKLPSKSCTLPNNGSQPATAYVFADSKISKKLLQILQSYYTIQITRTSSMHITQNLNGSAVLLVLTIKNSN